MSTNEQFAPNEDDLAMVQRPSTITILYMILVNDEGTLSLDYHCQILFIVATTLIVSL